jgi:hypothetical protein
MSKKRLSPAEARWRANYRYRRELAKWRAEEADGDPLGFVAELRKHGILARLAEATLATGPGATEPLRGIQDRLRIRRAQSLKVICPGDPRGSHRA